MKKTLIICVVVLVLKMHASAQSSFVKPVILGLKLGVNASFFTEDVDVFDPLNPFYDASFERFVRASGLAGVTVDYMVTERISVGAEILYNSRGMAYRQKNNNVIMIARDGVEQAYNFFKYNIDYIELPLTVNYNVLAVASDNWLTGYIGLAPAVAVGRKVKMDYPNVNAGPGEGEADQRTDLDHVRTLNTNVLVGIQVGSVPSFTGWYVDLRGSYTLLPVFSGDENNLKTKMLSFSLGMGLKF